MQIHITSTLDLQTIKGAGCLNVIRASAANKIIKRDIGYAAAPYESR